MNRRLMQHLPYLLIAFQGSVMAESASLGRLFFTPQQRALLDQQRRQPGLNPGISSPASSITLNGEIHSSSGHRTLWINGESGNATLPAGPELLVGETFHPQSGQRQPLLGDGQINVHPEPRQK